MGMPWGVRHYAFADGDLNVFGLAEKKGWRSPALRTIIVPASYGNDNSMIEPMPETCACEQ